MKENNILKWLKYTALILLLTGGTTFIFYGFTKSSFFIYDSTYKILVKNAYGNDYIVSDSIHINKNPPEYLKTIYLLSSIIFAVSITGFVLIDANMENNKRSIKESIKSLKGSFRP